LGILGAAATASADSASKEPTPQGAAGAASGELLNGLVSRWWYLVQVRWKKRAKRAFGGGAMGVKPELAFDVCWEVYRGAREVLESKRGISALNWKDTGKFLWRLTFVRGSMNGSRTSR
jgi:hypothetical protein